MERYGLIGYPLTHSFSQKYFSEKFLKEGLANHLYENFPINSIALLKDILANNKDLRGLNVTIPYKKEVLTYLDESSTAVKLIGACNCIKIVEGKLYGFNTDVIGFEKSLRPFLRPEHTAALILGTGGAAMAVAYTMQELGIHYQYVSRQKVKNGITYADIDQRIIEQHTLIINTTPLGMYPLVNDCPPLPYEWLTSKHHCFDLIYNPADTLFLQKSAAQKATIQNGDEMLIIQAEESWRIWNEVNK
ncbi:MAG: shikimate dehydrogenase [Chitinophagaceae bacterium]|nr:shikimate dehydrogenase [Chitinophagaceae bacterium]